MPPVDTELCTLLCSSHRAASPSPGLQHAEPMGQGRPPTCLMTLACCSCGVLLYVLLFHKYPFERADDPAGADGFAKVLLVPVLLADWVCKRGSCRALTVQAMAQRTCLPHACLPPSPGSLRAHGLLALHGGSGVRHCCADCAAHPAVQLGDTLRARNLRRVPGPAVQPHCEGASQLAHCSVLNSDTGGAVCSCPARVWGARLPAAMQDADKRFGTPEIMAHPWFLVGLPQGWDRLNAECLRKKVAPLAGSCQQSMIAGTAECKCQLPGEGCKALL